MRCEHCGSTIRKQESRYNLSYVHTGTGSAYCRLEMAEPAMSFYDPGDLA